MANLSSSKEIRSQIQRDRAADALAKAYVCDIIVVVVIVFNIVSTLCSPYQYNSVNVLVLTTNHDLTMILLTEATLQVFRRVILYMSRRYAI